MNNILAHLNKPIKYALSYVKQGNPRSVKIKKNIIGSIGLKGVSVLISFLLVPLTLNYLDATRYGLWLTISSMIGWFGFFDIGLGNGLRNKLAEAFAKNDYKSAKIYVSTTYAMLLIIVAIVSLFFFIFNHYANWPKILNIENNIGSELNIIFLLVFTFFALRFVLKLIGVIYTADQLPVFNNFLTPMGNLISLAFIYFLTKYTQGNLLYLSVSLSSAPIIVLIIASIISFKTRYKAIRPSIKSVKFKYIKSLAGLGVKFFVLQVASIVIFSTDNVIITRILGPAEVTPYNIASKYFGIPIMLFTIIITPYWSAFTDAITKNDIKWVKNSISKLVKIWLFVIVGVIFLLAISKYFYLMWVGDKVHIPFMLSAFMGLYAIISTWNNIFAFFINGVGKIKLQMYDGIFGMIINIPISIFFAKNLGMGSSGVILGTCFSLSIGSFLIPIQARKIINGRAKGIWNK